MCTQSCIHDFKGHYITLQSFNPNHNESLPKLNQKKKKKSNDLHYGDLVFDTIKKTSAHNVTL